MRLVPVLICLLITAPASAQVQLRFKFNSGDVIRQKMTQVMDSRTLVQGNEVKTGMKQTLRMEQQVEKVNPDGSAQIKQTITRLQMNLEAPFGQGFQFDSADPNGGKQLPLVGNLLSELAGAVFQARIAPTGQMSDLVVPESLLKAISGVPGSPFGDGGPESIKQMVGQSATVFPGKSLSKGDTWTEDKSMKMPFGEMKIHQTNTYDGKNSDGFDVIKIALQLELIPSENPQMTLTMKDSTATGQMIFDNQAGRLVRSDLKQNMTMNVTVAGQTMEQKIVQTVSVEPDTDSPN